MKGGKLQYDGFDHGRQNCQNPELHSSRYESGISSNEQYEIFSLEASMILSIQSAFLISSSHRVVDKSLSIEFPTLSDLSLFPATSQTSLRYILDGYGALEAERESVCV
jgi:hypothetical protein